MNFRGFEASTAVGDGRTQAVVSTACCINRASTCVSFKHFSDASRFLAAHFKTVQVAFVVLRASAVLGWTSCVCEADHLIVLADRIRSVVQWALAFVHVTAAGVIITDAYR